MNKSPIKMMVTDLDGTLLRSDKSISAYTHEVLQKCRADGMKITYATGRGYSAKKYAPCAWFDAKITMNGAVTAIEDEIITTRLIPWQTARPILLACAEAGMDVTSESGGVHYSNFDAAARWQGIGPCKITDFTQHEKDAEKIYIPNPTDAHKKIISQLLTDDLYFVITTDGVDSYLGQIMHKRATKGRAVLELAQ